MKFFRVKLNLSDSGAQPKLMQQLKADGAEVIQTGEGLCVKTGERESSLARLLKEHGVAAAPEPIDPAGDAAQNLPADIRAFLAA